MPKPTRTPMTTERTENLQTRVSPAELVRIKAAAAADGLTVSAWLRMQALRAAPESMRK